MEQEEKRHIFVVGHKNPDTDSICSAIAYADIKNRTQNEEEYVAMRAGQLNEETQYILKRLGIEAPELLSHVGTQVKDIEIRKTKGVNSGISLKKAWSLMKEANVVTLPITNRNEQLEGLITIGDIATSYMEVYDSTILAKARTKYKNIL